MALLETERIKLFTTRAPWFSAAMTLGITIGLTALIFGTASGDRSILTVAMSQAGANFGLAVVLALGALSVTTEYRYGTLRATFQAVPRRTSILLAKCAVVAAFVLVLGQLCAFGSLGVASLIRADGDLALNSTADWMNVAGVGVVYAIAAVIGIAAGLLIRHSAGAITALLIYLFVVEQIVQIIPSIGGDLQRWMPFNVAWKFLEGGAPATGNGMPTSTSTLGPWWALAYFAAVAAGLLAAALATVKRRDA